MADKKDNHVALWVAIILISVSVCVLTIRFNMSQQPATAQPTVPPVTLTPEQKQVISAVGENIKVAGQLLFFGVGAAFFFGIITYLIVMFREPKEAKKLSTNSKDETQKGD